MSMEEQSLDVRILPRDFVRDFIKLYKSFPCLWKVKHHTYNNRRLRNEAYMKMAEFCKERGFSDANRDFVAKKIQSLRGSFRKELKKMEQKGHETSLWYFDLLQFTVDQDEGDTNENRLREREAKRYFEQDDETENAASDSNSMFLLNNHDDNDDSNCFGDDDDDEQIQTPPSEEGEQTKKKRRLSTTKKSYRHKTITEYEAVGINVTRKLERMNEKQAILAESIINAVLKRGLLNELKEETCDGECRFLSQVSVAANPLDVESVEMKNE